jgi:hypothetical protein
MNLVEIGRRHSRGATPEQKAKIEINTRLAKDFADVVEGHCPDCPDRKAALDMIRRALEFANIAVKNGEDEVEW